ncbi:MAG: alpha/beta hydrolase [Comamonadaceae bacterium]|nr:alpha/beta hydrolase [Comamonadaceae bacterium]
MSVTAPFFVETGVGLGVVCLHANASTSGQWRALMALLAPRFHVLAPDTHGAGQGPAWPTDRALRLRDEVALIEPALERAGASPVLVGHSYGAAVALVAAAMHPGRFRALVLYEPTLFALLDAESPPPNEADGIRGAVAAAGAALDAGNADAAAGHFIDFWMGEGAWQHTPEARRGPIAESVRHVRGWADALISEPTPLSGFARLDVPVLLMSGGASPVSSLGVTRLLAGALPQVQTLTFDGAGHMGPITHGALINEAIARFLSDLPRQEESAA